MDKFAIRAGIFLAAGIVSIIFRTQLDDMKNSLLARFNIKDERKSYIYLALSF